MNNAESTPIQSVENKNSIKNVAKKAAAIGLLATGAVLAAPGVANAEDVAPTPAATAEASPSSDATPTPEPTDTATVEPTPGDTQEPTPEPTQPDDIDEVIGTPPPSTIEDGGAGTEVTPEPTPISHLNTDGLPQNPVIADSNSNKLPNTGLPIGEAALAAAAAIGAGVAINKLAQPKPTDIQLPPVGPEAPVQ